MGHAVDEAALLLPVGTPALSSVTRLSCTTPSLMPLASLLRLILTRIPTIEALDGTLNPYPVALSRLLVKGDGLGDGNVTEALLPLMMPLTFDHALWGGLSVCEATVGELGAGMPAKLTSCTCTPLTARRPSVQVSKKSPFRVVS